MKHLDIERLFARVEPRPGALPSFSGGRVSAIAETIIIKNRMADIIFLIFFLVNSELSSSEPDRG